MIQGTMPKDWIDYLQALLNPAIALFGILIAWLQWRINHNRLKLERFEHRFSRFEATRKFLQSIVQRSDRLEEERIAFLSATVGSRFVFDDKVAEFLNELDSKAVDLYIMNDDMQSSNVAYARLSKKRSDLMHWFIDQLRGLEKRFAKYF